MPFSLRETANFYSAYLPFFLPALVLLEPMLLPRGHRRESLRFFGWALVTQIIAVGIAESSKALTHSGFPSGHTTFTATLCAILAYRRRGLWVPLGVLLTVLMAVTLVYGGWHTPLDVCAAILLSVATVAVFRHRLQRAVRT